MKTPLSRRSFLPNAQVRDESCFHDDALLGPFDGCKYRASLEQQVICYNLEL